MAHMAGWHCGGEASTTAIRLLLLHHSQTARAIHPHSLCNQSSGIGRGGIKEKKFTQPKDGRLDDEVTPTGLFTVDVIMSEDGTHDAVSDVVRERYKDDARYGEFITHEGGLNRLFKNMNALDFNRDAYADNAYGKAYFGLNVAGTEAEDAKKIRLSWQGLCYSKWCWVKTGPKMTIHFVDGTEQVGWHSVAIHGTNRRDKLGRASSGGAVYIKSDVIASIFETKHLHIGSLVKIADEAFLSPTHPFLPPVAPHLSHISPFILVFYRRQRGDSLRMRLLRRRLPRADASRCATRTSARARAPTASRTTTSSSLLERESNGSR